MPRSKLIVVGIGSLFDADVDALVNAVNTVGVMGKGLALEMKRAFPENFVAYREACESGAVGPGRMFTFDRGPSLRPRWIVNFPTKRHFRDRSRIEDVDAGLVDLVAVVHANGIRSIAIPALGCGLGGLEWSDVRPRIVAALKPVDAEVHLFAPRS